MKIRFFILFLLVSISGSAQELAFSKSPEKSSFGLGFDNDIWNKTDNYYTNGVSFTLTAPFLKKSPLNYILIPFNKYNDTHSLYGLELKQEMYTPIDLVTPGIKPDDRPFASLLYLSEFRVSNNMNRFVQYRSELQLGVIGNYALGEQTQSFIHVITPSEVPEGWDYQIKNDLILNYNFSVSKGLVKLKYFEWIYDISL